MPGDSKNGEFFNSAYKGIPPWEPSTNIILATTRPALYARYNMMN